MEFFEASIELACSLENAFEFLVRPENIKLISPPSVGLFFVAAPTRLDWGARMLFKVQAFGVAREATHEIIDFTPSTRFVERQIEGPLGSWLHDHVFEATPRGVLVTDRIQFESPRGVAGLLISKNRILEHLEDGFDYRHEQLQKRLGK